MVKKKGKGTKKLRKRANSWTEEDVRASTSLPPMVEGQLRCYLKVSINQILWMVPNPPETTHVRLLWWGESGDGTIFRPVDVKKKTSEQSRTTARFPIRSGPKQFAAYLNDMTGLVLDVLSGPLMLTIGRAQIDHIGSLSPIKPINGFFPVFSADNEKVGELQASIVLESLMASYDSQSSVPTPDMSLDVYSGAAEPQQVNPPRALPTPQPRPAVYNAADDPFTSPGAHKTSGRTTPQGVDGRLYGNPQLYGEHIQKHTPSRPIRSEEPSTSNPSYPRSTSRGEENQLRNTLDSQASTLKGISSLNSEVVSSAEDKLVSASSGKKTSYSGYNSSELRALSSDHGTVDLVTALLEKGNKLREAMIISTIDRDPKLPHMTDNNNPAVFSPLKRKDSGGDLFREILKPQSDVYTEGDQLMVDVSDTENRAVDLVLGDYVTEKEFKMLKALGGSPGSSVSGDDVVVDSDLGDPIHDDSILEELFYKGSEESDILSDFEESPLERRRKESIVSLEDPGNARPPSRSSVCSSPLDREPVRESDPILPKSRGRSKTKAKPTKEKKNKNNSKQENGSVSRSRSRSRSQSRERKKKKKEKSDQGSDLDVPCSPRSETSRVSFDPTPSDIDDEIISYRDKKSHKAPVDGLSIERLTLLGRVHVSRVMIDHFEINEEQDSILSTPRSKTKSQKGKPPRPTSKPRKNCTYFVEYQFPVVATSRDKHQPNAMATEVMRIASKKVADSGVSFGHRSVFPVMFDGEAIEKWWKSALVFKVYSKTPGQKVPRLMGMCSVPLKSVLKSDALFIDRNIAVKDRSSARSDTSRGGSEGPWPVVGHLKLSIELASDSKDFSTALARTRLAEMTNAKIIPIPQPKPKPKIPSRNSSAERLTHRQTGKMVPGSTFGTQTEPQKTDISSVPLVLPPDRVSYQHTVQSQQQQNAFLMEPVESLTLHTLLAVPDGMNITLQGLPPTRHGDKTPSQPLKPLTSWTGRDMATRNLYLIARMFWCDDISRSGVCWGTFDPQFNFFQVTPMLLTASLLERMRNNFMIIEVWDKKTTSENDQLVGIVKLPLHQFYMSYRDRKVAASLLRSQYPVVSVDTDMPIVNPFSGAEFGKLRILLAMGSTEQVSSLQRLKGEYGTAVAVPDRPSHYLERQNVFTDGRADQAFQPKDNIAEHTFEVCVESIRGLKLLDNMIWGEADCFIQYHFPAQTSSRQQGGPSIIQATPSLQTFRSATTLCIPDPVFNDVTRHKLVLPEGSPVQREILTACAGVGGGAGGIPFEVWCRYYYPNVRDQVIAKGMLPLAKLCAMVTMQRRGESNTQTFSLPLASLVPDSDAQEGELQTKMPECGLLEVTINYKTNIMKKDQESKVESMSRSLPGATVCIAVGILKAAGLKAGAVALARHDVGMQYAAEVGVNCYARVKLSFFQKEDERLTRTVARSFAPEFGYHLDFPCPLLWTDPDSDALSLAEILENAEASFELWHQSPSSPFDGEQYTNTGSSAVTGRRLVSLGGDVLLGTVTVPLLGLLTRKTGINGWFAVNLPSVGWETTPVSDLDQSEESSHHGNRGLERVIGGLELAIKFAHHEDLDRVVHAGRGVGWSPDYDIEHRDWDSADELLDCFHQVTVSVDLCTFPAQNALITGQTRLDSAARCYIRYKLYDKGAVCSHLCPLEQNDEGYAIADIQHHKTMIIAGSSPFSWYLREERLEVQIWVTYHAQEGEKKRPRNRDKLIGSAFLDMAPLADTRRRQHRISDLYPLFKPGASSLGGACVRAHITLKPHTGGLVESDEDDLEMTSKTKHRSPYKSPVKKSPVSEPEPAFSMDLENTFPVHISVERALHLPMVVDRGVSMVPSCYVSYQTADQSDVTCTEVYPHNSDPVWSHDHDTRLSVDLLQQGQKNLVFKVWHKQGDVSSTPDVSVDRVLGFVSLDLAPLTTGFYQICGWYNIMDFNGQCQGQIKVAVSPQQQLQGLSSVQGPDPTLQQPQSLNPQAPSYTTQASYPVFPTHLSWYPEQHITSHPPSEKSPETLPHFSEHFENVKKHHHQLQQKMHEMGVADPNVASRSILFGNLRSHMSELDEITAKLKQKLYSSDQPPPPAPIPEQSFTPTTTANMFHGQKTNFSDYTLRETETGDTRRLLDSTDAAELQRINGELENLRFENGDLASTGGISRGYDAGTEDNGNLGSTGFTDFLSTQNTDIPSYGLPDGLTERSENDQTIFTQTLEHAQQVLQAIHQAQARYNNNGPGGPDTVPSTMTQVTQDQRLQYTLDDNHHPGDTQTGSGFANEQKSDNEYSGTFDQDFRASEVRFSLSREGTSNSNFSEGGDTKPKVLLVDDDETGHGAPHHEDNEDGAGYEAPHREDNEEEWEEEDTFAKDWAARPSDLHSDILSEISHVHDADDGEEQDHEESVIMPKPLNDISSVLFDNAVDESYRNSTEVEDHDKNDSLHSFEQAEEQVPDWGTQGISTGNTERTSDTFFAAQETSWKGDLSTGDINLGSRSALDNVQFEDSMGSHQSQTPVEEEHHDIQHNEEDLDLAEVRSTSRTSLSSNGSSKKSKGRSGRKEAMSRREHQRQNIEEGGSTEDEEKYHSRKRENSKSRRKNQRRNQQDEISNEPQGVTLQDPQLDTSLTQEHPQNTVDGNLSETHGDERSELGRTQDNVDEGSGVCVEKDTHSGRSEHSDRSQPNSARNNGSKQNIGTSGVPNFFLPHQDMEQSMRTLTTSVMPGVRVATNEDPERLQSKAVASREILNRLEQAGERHNVKSLPPSTSTATRISAKRHTQPSQEQAQRIAKIFAQKFS